MAEITRTSIAEFTTGSGSVGTTPEALQPPLTIYKGVRIKADDGNAGTLYVGPSTVSTNGYPLAAGEEIIIEIDQLSKVFVVASEAGQNYRYFAQ